MNTGGGRVIELEGAFSMRRAFLFDTNADAEISVGLDITYCTEADGRIIADVESVRGAIAYGNTREEAARKALAIALEIIADEIENGERPIRKTKICFDGCFPS